MVCGEKSYGTPRVARQLSIWGDFPVVTAAILASMRVPVSIDRGLAPSDRVQVPARTAMPEMIRETPVAPSLICQRQQPLVSVIITAHNEGAEVLRTIESVEANTKVPIEFLVVDDGSTHGCCAEPGSRTAARDPA